MNYMKMKKICQTGLCLALSAFVLAGPMMVKAQGNAVMPSGLTVSETQEELDALIESELLAETISVTGGAVRLSIEDEIVYSKDFGHADLENGLLVDDNTVFEWGSASHLLVWTSILQLEEDGLLDLNTEVAAYLPEGELKEELTGSGVTIEHLMNYSSGYHDSFSEKLLPEGSAYSGLAETLENNIPKQTYAAGNVVAFSDWSTGLAAYIVEYVSGADYANYVKENIFTPLGMEHTALLPDLSDNEAVMNARKEVKSYQGNMALANNFYHVPLYPAGMVTGTMEDFHTFANELLVQSGESKLFESEETAETLFDTTCFYTGSEEARIAHGMFVYRFGVPVYGIRGTSATQTALVYLEPESKTCLTYMTNQYNEADLSKTISETVFGICELAKAEEISGLRVYEGVYISGNSAVDGKAAFSGFMSALFLTLNDNDQLVMPMFGQLPMFDIIDESHVTLSDGSIGNMYAYPDGTTVIMMPTTDYVSYSAFTYFAQMIALIVMLVGYFYSSLVVIIAVFGFVIRKINKSKLEESKFRKYHYIQCLNVTVFCLIFAFMVLMLMSSAPMASIKSTAIMYWLGSVMSLIYFIFFWKSGRKEEVSKKTKILYWTTAVFAVITVIFALLFGLIF